MIKIAIIAEFPIGVLTGQMMGRGGGHAATWLPQLATAWKDITDCEIHWCVLDRSTRKICSVRRWNQTFHRIPSPGVSVGMLLGRWPQRLAYRGVLRNINPDVVHCWGTETLHGVALWEFDGPSILSMQGVVATYAKTGDLKGWRWKLFKHWESQTIRRATLVTSESQWGLDRVAEIAPGKKSSRVEYGVFPGYYEIVWSPEPAKPRILFVGGLNRLKGVDILVEMLRKHPVRNWKMVFAGGGYLEGPLRALNDPNIEVLGTLKTGEVQDQMAKAWALVLPSRADTSPNVVKEARVIGLPVVASPHGGHAEYIQHGIDGLIMHSECPEDWFQALDRLAADLDKCRSMGVVHHKQFRDYFRPENTASQFLGLYRELCPQ
jgi:glycosyltransferase involved in cell wall biosynthesis